MKIQYQTLVRIAIDDKSNESISALLDWSVNNHIYPERVGSTIGGGRFRAFFTPANAKKVKVFLSKKSWKKK